MDVEKGGVTALALAKNPTNSSRTLMNKTVLVTLVVCVVVLPFVVAFYGGALWNLSPNSVYSLISGKANCGLKPQSARFSEGSTKNSSFTLTEKLLRGLLSSGFDESSCFSRYNTVLYRKLSPHTPSQYLIERLRKYEDLHKKCCPSTELYKKSIEQLKSNQSNGPMECSYVVWLPWDGIGNRMLTLASVFLYAILTNRVLLVENNANLAYLFCEPFPDSSWFLPDDFPLIPFNDMNKNRYGEIVNYNGISINGAAIQTHVFIYIHLIHDYSVKDKRFFCDEDQLFLKKIPWLVMRSNNYYAVSFFEMPGFEEELNKMFPSKNTVFHHLGRYLFHPTNGVWDVITRYYDRYLADVDTRLGIQVRVFHKENSGHLGEQIMACALEEKLLPEISDAEEQFTENSTKTAKSKAVLVTSLSIEYYDRIQNMYWEHSASNGEIITVFQPSHEESQRQGLMDHEMKALAEIYLLSMCDELVTSAASTFGYIAQALGNLKPWILDMPNKDSVPDPPCRRAMSMEPCFHAAPHYDCKKNRVDNSVVPVPYIRRCEDLDWGLKLVDRDQ